MTVLAKLGAILKFEGTLYETAHSLSARTTDATLLSPMRFARDSADLGLSERSSVEPRGVVRAVAKALDESVDYLEMGDLVSAFRTMGVLYAMSLGHAEDTTSILARQATAVEMRERVVALLGQYGAAIFDGKAVRLQGVLDYISHEDALLPSLAADPWFMLLVAWLRMQLWLALESRSRRTGNWFWMSAHEVVGYRLLQATAAYERSDFESLVLAIMEAIMQKPVSRLISPRIGQSLPRVVRQPLVRALDAWRAFPAAWISASYESVLLRPRAVRRATGVSANSRAGRLGFRQESGTRSDRDTGSKDQINLLSDLLSVHIETEEGFPFFEKRGVQRDVPLLRRATRALSEQVSGDIDAVCSLATSGIPLGVYLAQELSKPLFFYRTAGWPIGMREFPRIAVRGLPGSRCLLVDTHARRGRTSALADATIASSYSNAQVAGIATLLDISPEAVEYPIPVERYSLVPIETAIEYVCQHPGVDIAYHSIDLIKPGSPFWRFSHPETKLGGHPSRRRRWRLHIPTSLATPRMISYPSQVGTALAEHVPTDDEGIWSLYFQSGLLRDISEELGQHLAIRNYDALVGVNALGTAFACTLAYYTEFGGPIFSHYYEPRLYPEPGDGLEGKRVLLCQTRLLTGQYTAEAIRVVRAYGAICRDIVVACLDRKQEPWLRQQPLRNLAGTGVIVHMLVPQYRRQMNLATQGRAVVLTSSAEVTSSDQ